LGGWLARGGAEIISRFLDRNAIKKTRTFKKNARFGTAEAVPFRLRCPI